ncbi:MAG: HTTM domain-containing protein [Bacteroidota bacterium]|nr:HTTM domain-containing protein [Bacteroidota bacterium]
MMITNSTCSQIRAITRISAAGCLAAMLLSYKLWLSARPFPTSPVSSLIPALQSPFDFILLGLIVLSLTFTIVLRNPQKFILLFIICACIMMLTDQNRWQPWFYQYLLMFFVLAGFNFRCDNEKFQEAILGIFKIMIAAVYFWSGLQKMNPNFISDTFPWIMDPITRHLAEGSISHFLFLGKAFPLIEIFTGILLLFTATRRYAAIIAITMHVFILFVLGPAGHDYNYVVWPWNVAMIAFCSILFLNKNASAIDFRKILNYPTHKLVFLLFILMPLLNFFGYWDSYLSHNLYSGNTSNGSIYFSENVRDKLPEEIKKYAVGDSIQYQINIKYWCMMELGVPAYPEKRNFESVTSTFYPYAADSSEIYFLYGPKSILK